MANFTDETVDNAEIVQCVRRKPNRSSGLVIRCWDVQFSRFSRRFPAKTRTENTIARFAPSAPKRLLIAAVGPLVALTSENKKNSLSTRTPHRSDFGPVPPGAGHRKRNTRVSARNLLILPQVRSLYFPIQKHLYQNANKFPSHSRALPDPPPSFPCIYIGGRLAFDLCTYFFFFFLLSRTLPTAKLLPDDRPLAADRVYIRIYII